MQTNKFQLNLSGLLQVLAEHLYSTRKVAIRELIQNAHDGCIRRQSEDRRSGYRPRINVRIDASNRTISIEDNGAGLTEDEITNYLTTIGSSYTRELGQKLQMLSPDEASRLIGQFGLGFLSAFLIASEVTLTTRSYKNEQGLRWFCDGSEYFQLEPVARAAVGTLVEIKLKPEAEFLLGDSVLKETIRRYADFLSIPIYLNGEIEPVNLMMPPWDASDPQTAIQDYIERAFHQRQVTTVIPLHDQVIDLGHDTLVIPMQGFVYIPASTMASFREYGDMIVYIRKMFITDDHRHLLPAWARFFRGVIDCPLLQPTASRENLHEEENFLAVQQALESQLLAAMRKIAQEQPDIWRQIVSGHTELVLGWVIANDEFFAQVADSILLRTTRGLLSLPDYLKHTADVAYFVTQEMGSLQEQLLGEVYEVPVIDASWFGVSAFLEKYAARNPHVKLVQMDGDSRQLLRPVSDEACEGLLQFYRSQRILAKAAAFKPTSLPGVVLYPRNAEAINSARRALDSGELSGPFAAMVEEYLNQQKDDDTGLLQQAEGGVLYLNVSSPLIQQLIEQPTAKNELALTLIYHIARLFAARNLTPADAGLAFQEVTNSIQGLVKS